MNSTQVFNLIERIAATSSKKEKEALLVQHSGDAMLRNVLSYAYDPFKTYGVADKTVKSMAVSIGPFGAHVFDGATWDLLDALQERKVTGSAAIDAIVGELARLEISSGALLKRILLKDLRAGFSESTINKAMPGLIPDFPYMRCSLPDAVNLDEWDWSQGHISQEKADGMFANINVEEGVVRVTSRQGSLVPVTAELVERLSKLPRACQYHGEILVIDAAGKVLPREIGNGKLNSLIQGGQLDAGLSLQARLWDMIPLSAVVPKGKHDVPYRERLAALARAVIGLGSTQRDVLVVETEIVYSLGEARAHCAGYTRLGKEGTILKHRDAIWRDGTSKQQVKFKVTFEVDLVVVGFEEGKGKNAKTFGSIICETSCGQLRVSVSGFSDAVRADIHARREEVMGTIVTAAANGVMTPSKEGGLHSLFLPRWVEFRADKSEADDLNRVSAQFRAAMGM